MKLGEFFIELFVKGADDAALSVKGLIDNFGQLDVASVLQAGVMSALGYKFVHLAEEVYDTAAAFKLFENSTGLSAEQLQFWQGVAVQANVSAEAMSSSVMGLQKQLTNISMGRGNAMPFQVLGIDPRQSAFGVLRQLRDVQNRFPPAMFANMMTEMGLDPSMINVLKLSNAEFEKFAKNAVIMSAGQEKAFLKQKLALTQLSMAIKRAGYDIVTAFGPKFESVLNAGSLIIGSLANDAEMLANNWERWHDGIALVGTAFLALGAYLFPVTTAIVAFALALDDIAAYQRGGKSVTGKLIDDLKNINEGLKGEGINDLMDYLTGSQGSAKNKYAVPAVPFSQSMLGRMFSGQSADVTINQHITSTAPAAAVADHVNKGVESAVKSGLRHASTGINNGGKN